MTGSGRAETPRERLARLMDHRRAELGLRWLDVAQRAGLTTEGLRGVRNGTAEMRSLSKVGIERSLRWRPGSVDAILAGGDPAPLRARTPERPATRLSYQEIEIREIRRMAEELAERTRRLEEQRGAADSTNPDEDTA